jgi:aspartate aminotransferase-like enzyme
MLKQRLRIPGPTEVPEEALNAMAAPMISHRGKEFEELFINVTNGLKTIFQTKNDVLIFPAAGTGGLEAAVVNLFSPGEKILAVTVGVFGDRFADICKAFGLNVEKLDFPWGTAADIKLVEDVLNKDKNKEIKGVIVTHNETSTGVMNDVKSIGEIVKSHGALFIVDAVSSLGAVDLKTDDWGIDVVVTSSQKALMVPPGLALISVSPKAWYAVDNSKSPRYYWDFKKAKNSAIKGQTPYTPAIPQLFALAKSIEKILDEGLDNVFRRHVVLSAAFRAGVRAAGLQIFAAEGIESLTVTAVKTPAGITPSAVRNELKNRFGIVTAGGQQQLKNEIFRIGHMGYIDAGDIIYTLSAIEAVLPELGIHVEAGSATRQAGLIITRNDDRRF